MIWVTSIALLVSVTALAVSIGALFAAARLRDQFHSTSAARLSAKLTERLDEQQELLQDLSQRHKALRQRMNMLAYRDRQSAQPAPPEPEATDPEGQAAEVRANLNDALARGAAKGLP